jgi:threonine dehydrogenase-like Zn-dependent dehydrogenase
MMKAVVLHEADDMRVEQRPVPDPGSGEVLLKVNVTSICGTDVKVRHRKLLGQPDGPLNNQLDTVWLAEP